MNRSGPLSVLAADFDGIALTKLMVRYNVGVRVRETFDLKQIDEETFEE